MQQRPRTPGKPRLEGLIRILGIVTAVAIVGAAGIGVWKLSQDTPIASSPELPAFVHDALAPPDTPKAYQGAIDHGDAYAQIPCYCGCAETEGHESLKDCFIESEQDGTIAFSRHGAG